MDNDTIADLKQFISATVSQNTMDIRQDISGIKGDISGIKGDIQRLDKKIDDLTDSVASAMHSTDEAVDEQLHSHEKRITKLEQKPA